MRLFFVATAALVLSFMATELLLAEADDVPLNKLPPAVVAAVKARFPKAELLSAEKKTEKEKMIYEVDLKYDGHKTEARLTLEGKWVSIEKTIETKDAPAAVLAAVADKYGKDAIEGAEEVYLFPAGKEKLDHYNLSIKPTKGKAFDVTVSVDGKSIEKVEEEK